MLNDRNYYAQCDDTTLITLALEGDSELALVLAERLAGALIDIETADRDEIRDLLDRVSDLEAELSEARSTINYLETELENAQ
jgi:hypothetical protein